MKPFFAYTDFMAVLPIITGADHPVLRKKTVQVPQVTKEVKKLLKDMRDTLKVADGAGIAAPQIGSSLRICIATVGGKQTVLINPEITMKGKTMTIEEEGCLSLPGLQIQVPRYTDIVVEFLSEKGVVAQLRLKDFDARVVQHEVDHLDGVLIVDYMPVVETRAAA